MTDLGSSPPEGVLGWRRGACLGCGEIVKAHRDHYVTFIGTTDGSVLAVFPVRPELALQTAEVVGRTDLLLLGVAHRVCMDLARTSIEAGSLRSRPSSEFPPATAAEVEDDGESMLDEPPDADSCPFCGSAFKLTDEDIWPMWFWQYLREAGANFPGQRLPRVTTPVCADCNHRWMSVMENDAAAVMKRMFRQQMELSAEDRRRLACWAMKVTLLLDVISTPVIPRGFHRDFAIRRDPPAGFVVWMGAYGGNDVAAWGRARGFVADGSAGSDPRPNAVVATFSAFRIVFQVVGHFTSGGARLTDGRWQYAKALTSLWPSTVQDTVHWPPSVMFASPTDLEALDESISGT